MNYKYIIGILVFIVVTGGGFYMLNTKNMRSNDEGKMVKDASGRPITQSHRSYKIELLSNTRNIKPLTPTTISYRIKNDIGDTIKEFETVHEKIMHFLVVRKDLQEFQHLHPEFDSATGEFTVQVTFTTDGPYRIFPDFTPGDQNNPMQLPVTVFSDVNVGDTTKYTALDVVADTQAMKNQDGYQVSYDLPSSVQNQVETTYTLTIQKNGQPVTDVETYLGALGHSVIIKEDTLNFIHTHAGEADASNPGEHGGGHTAAPAASGPEIRFTTTFPEPGTYKLFTQFQHQGKVHATDFVVKVN